MEAVGRDALCREGLCQRSGRGAAAFIRQLEGAPVMAHGIFRAREHKTIDRLGRILVLVAHEPAGFVGADGQDGGADAAVLSG